MLKVNFLKKARDFLLIKKAKRGEKDAFGKLYLAYLDAIFRYIYFRIGEDRETAEDLVQDVFFKAWDALDKFDPNKGTFQAWLYRVAANQVVDFQRTNKSVSRINENFIASEISGEQSLENSLNKQKLLLVINKLNDAQREIITLKYINDLSSSEIASILGKQNDAVRALEHRAIKNLRKELTKDE